MPDNEARPRLTTSQFIKTPKALTVVKRYCDQMAAQEERRGDFHTILAVDPDVIHMAAFPVHNLAQGSVFHDWSYLRALGMSVAAAPSADARKDAIENIFSHNAARIPLLTTIALTDYIFRWRSEKSPIPGFVVLPPHRQEWLGVRKRARERHHSDLGSALRAQRGG